MQVLGWKLAGYILVYWGFRVSELSLKTWKDRAYYTY